MRKKLKIEEGVDAIVGKFDFKVIEVIFVVLDLFLYFLIEEILKNQKNAVHKID